jgi:hypothetical protein
MWHDIPLFHLSIYNENGVIILSQRESDQNVIHNARTTPSLRSQTAAATHRLQLRALYDQVGSALRQNNVHHVVFHTCNVGRDIQFIQRISQDWGTEITAYQRQIVFNDQEDNCRFIRTYLQGELPGTGNNTTRGRSELPTGPLAVTVRPSHI